jgi:glycine oxidase
MKVLVIGCGMVGAMTAYGLTRAGLEVTVCESQPSYAQGASGSALGVLMAVCSSKGEGAIAQLRLASLKLFDCLLEELHSEFQLHVPCNRAGILCLYESDTAEEKCAKLIAMRQSQGYTLEWQPTVAGWHCAGAMYSPSDRWVHPSKLISALVSATIQLGGNFHFHTPITDLYSTAAAFDRIVITAGLGTNQLIGQSILHAVRGLALTLELPELDLSLVANPFSHKHHAHCSEPQSFPVVHAVTSTGEDINIVPLGNQRYWLGATVHFNPEDCQPQRDIEWLLETAAKFQPLCQRAQVINSWIGDRPRPKYQKAPILGFLTPDKKILAGVGHYRNGILMAPITAQIICDLILHGHSEFPWQSFAPQFSG